jgi:hypothetical protein
LTQTVLPSLGLRFNFLLLARASKQVYELALQSASIFTTNAFCSRDPMSSRNVQFKNLANVCGLHCSFRVSQWGGLFQENSAIVY